MELTNEVYDSINRYFSVLSHTGYKPYTEVNKLIVYSFIEEFLNGPMSFYITDKDYRDISNVLECIYGSCMIPYTDYRQYISNAINVMPDAYRASDINVLRITETSDLRINS